MRDRVTSKRAVAALLCLGLPGGAAAAATIGPVGATEYQVVQTLINLTGTPWTGYHYELGFGTGAGFVRSAAGDLLDFDAPDTDPAPTSSGFGLPALGTDALDWSGGTVPSVGVASHQLSIDVPGGTAVPEPGSLVIPAAALGRRAGRARAVPRALNEPRGHGPHAPPPRAAYPGVSLGRGAVPGAAVTRALPGSTLRDPGPLSTQVQHAPGTRARPRVYGSQPRRAGAPHERTYDLPERLGRGAPARPAVARPPAGPTWPDLSGPCRTRAPAP